MAKRVSDDLNVPPQPLDPVASRIPDFRSDITIHDFIRHEWLTISTEERRATGRMIALMVAFILILSVLYQAWIKKIPVLAGITIPALIMIIYGGWVLFLAKKDKQRRINAENNLRASRADSIALSEVASSVPLTSQTTTAVSQNNKVEVSKKVKPKASKIILEDHGIDKKPQFENTLPQIAINAYDNDGKLSRSFSTYN